MQMSGLDCRFPVQLDLCGRLAVIIGDGDQADRAVRAMLDHGADILVISPLVSPIVDELVAEGRVEHEERAYVRGDLAGAFIVFCSSGAPEIDRAVYQEAEGAGCLVHVAGCPEWSSFEVSDDGAHGGAR